MWESPFTTITPQSGAPWVNQAIDPDAQEGFFIPYGCAISPPPCLRPDPSQRSFWWIDISTDGLVDAENEEAYAFLFLPAFKQTTLSGPLILAPRYRFDALAMFNVEADSATVAMGSYQVTKALTYADSTGLRKEVAFLDLPESTPGSTLTITLTGANKLGYLCLGLKNQLGTTQYGTEIGLTDYSHKVRDTFGAMDIIVREYALRVDFKFWSKTRAIGQLRRLMAQLRTTPAAYLARGNVEETLVLGFYHDFSAPIQVGADSDITLTVEGLV